MTKKILYVLTVIGVLVLAGGLFAFTQVLPTTAQPVTESLIVTILGASIFGMPLSALAELLKRLLLQYLHFPDKPWTGYLVSAITVAAGCYIVLTPLGMLTVQNFLTAFLIALAVANGLYKITVKAAQEKTAAQIAKLTGDLNSIPFGDLENSLSEATKLLRANGAGGAKEPFRPITGFGQ